MSKRLLRLSAILLLPSLMLSVSGCGGTSAISECSWVQIITVSKQDVLTDQTAREILSHNLKVETVCGKGNLSRSV